jgi:hypothetical protein
MSENPEPHDTPTQRRTREYEDPHYHDDDEVAPAEEGDKPRARPPARRKWPQRPRHRYEED